MADQAAVFGSGRGSVRIGVVDDHPLFAAAVEQLVAGDARFIWAGSAGNVDELLEKAPCPEVVVLDLRLEDRSVPRENVARLRAKGARVLVCTSGEHPELLRSAARSGAHGVVLKSEPPPAILAALLATADDEPVLTQHWAAAIDGDPDLGQIRLSPRLQRVLTLYASGRTAAAIAAELGISAFTVNDYLKRIRLKYAEAGRPTRTKLDLVKRAMEDGFLPYPRRGR